MSQIYQGSFRNCGNTFQMPIDPLITPTAQDLKKGYPVPKQQKATARN
jgi:hypothetical protein